MYSAIALSMMPYGTKILIEKYDHGGLLRDKLVKKADVSFPFFSLSSALNWLIDLILSILQPNGNYIEKHYVMS